MSFPLVYELNTRCWLRALSEKAGRDITLANIPESELERWERLGFSHVWLMGVWTTGPRSRQKALMGHGAELKQLDPDFDEEDIVGSPYAISEYQVPSTLGGKAGLRIFREKLRGKGLKLLLDFVPNHVGLDHPWVKQKPELFVQSPSNVAGTFKQKTDFGTRWLAYGKDPNFAPWEDTVQLNYQHAETRAAMIECLCAIAQDCDGVRCDMAMLVLNDVFVGNWSHLTSDISPDTEFWADAIEAVRRHHPHFLLLAEAYWGLEPRLQALGFDFTYHKSVYDLLMQHKAATLQKELLVLSGTSLSARAHFLENHDERRIASLLSFDEHRAAALLTFSLPGLRLLYEGQLEGWGHHTPVQLERWPGEPSDQKISAWYEQLLTTLKNSAVGRGASQLLQPIGWVDNASAENFVIIQWQSSAHEFDLVVVNLAAHASQCRVRLFIPRLESHQWEMRDLLGVEIFQRDGADMQAHGLYLALSAHGAQLFRFRMLD